MRYGRWSEDGREFIIENQATPRPWINYLYNREYFTTVSNNGGGISYHRIPLHGRVTRYRINDVPPDRPGKYLYLRDAASGRFWSLTWQPVGRDLERYRVAHGFGYTRAEAEVAGVVSTVVFFVPPDRNLEVWKVRLLNATSRPRRLSLVGYVEFCLGHALVDLINQCDDQHFNRVHFSERQNALFATKTYWVTGGRGTQFQENKAWDQWAFFACSRPVAAYEAVRERFIGAYRNESNPLAVERDEWSNRGTDFGNAVGALKVDVNLAAGEAADILFNLGVIPKRDENERNPRSPRTYLDLGAAEKALRRVKEAWDAHLRHVVVETPDPDVNIFLNHWTPYQAKVAFDVGRVASFYYWGISRGFGFRDSAQDTIGLVIADPERVRERIGLLARQMFRDGRVYHHFYRDGQGEVTTHCDDPLWFILAVTEYIKETGDTGLLAAREAFAGGGSGTILDHLEAVVRFAGRNVGPHGLPVFGRGDWNDTLDYIGGKKGGESVWGGMFTAAMMDRLAELLGFAARRAGGGRKRARRMLLLRGRAARLRDDLRTALEKHCWDGAWFIRAFGGDGRRIGSRTNTYGRIFLNTQSWAVLAGVGGGKLQRRAMDSVGRRLDTSFGPKICAPAFRRVDPAVGLITRCVVGKKENAAIFLHPTAWLIQAECRLGRGERAFAYYKKLLPNAIDSETFQAEPYVYSQYITSDEHPTVGMASHSWQTGTAAWMFRVAVDDMLGVRPAYDGLVVDPVVPIAWKKLRVERVFRGTRYIVDIENPAGRERGVREVWVDGIRQAGNLIPPGRRKLVRVRAVL